MGYLQFDVRGTPDYDDVGDEEAAVDQESAKITNKGTWNIIVFQQFYLNVEICIL